MARGNMFYEPQEGLNDCEMKNARAIANARKRLTYLTGLRLDDPMRDPEEIASLEEYIEELKGAYRS